MRVRNNTNPVFGSSSLSIHPSIFGAQLLLGNSRLLFGWLSPLRTEKKRLRDFFLVQKPRRICRTLSSSLARSLDLSLSLSHSHRPFRMESSPLPLIERAKSCGFSTRWTLQMASSWEAELLLERALVHSLRFGERHRNLRPEMSEILINKYHDDGGRIAKWQVRVRPCPEMKRMRRRVSE